MPPFSFLNPVIPGYIYDYRTFIPIAQWFIPASESGFLCTLQYGSLGIAGK
jgi:hypothetical protein